MKKDIDMDQILNATYDGIVAIDQNGKIILFNKAAKRIFNLPDKSYLGEDILNVTPDARMPAVMASKKPEVNFSVKERGALDLITSRMPIINEAGVVRGAVAVFKDVPKIGELSIEIDRLEEMQSLMRGVFSSAYDAISVSDTNGIIIMTNKAFEELVGMKEKEIIGKPCDFYVKEGKSIHRAVLKAGEEKKDFRLKIGNSGREVIAHGSPILVNDEIKGSVVVFHDITDIKIMVAELDKARNVIRRIEGKYTFTDIIGENESLLNSIHKAKRAAITPATILLEGESGTGKELFAHAIHNESSRREKPFIRVNCAAISDSLLESELFGYEGGAFTGANRAGKSGYFEQANLGTIFLDEVGKMNLNLQGKLLRVLQEKELIRVGGNSPISVDVRVIAATNIDIENEIKLGNFREDLYYRLNVVPICIPPLRERSDDIPNLCSFIIKKYNVEFGRAIVGISGEALDLLSKNIWKGNVRELENYIERAIIDMEADETYIKKKHLPEISKKNIKEEEALVIGNNEIKNLFNNGIDLKETIKNYERKCVKAYLEKNQGTKMKTARMLNISIRKLYNMLDELE